MAAKKKSRRPSPGRRKKSDELWLEGFDPMLLKERRESMGLTQEELRERFIEITGVRRSITSFKNWESKSKKKVPGGNEIRGLAAALECDMEDFYRKRKRR